MLQRMVRPADLEELLSAIGSSVAKPLEGLFGPESISWRVNRESALFLGAGRAALMQLAHPWVAAAIAEHSKTLQRPVARFHRTFRVIFTMMFGTVQQAADAARQLHRLHQTIRGTLPESAGRFTGGSGYEANEVDALRWVFATLIESAVVSYELVLAPLTDGERELYYAESLRVAALFGIAATELPPSWNSFGEYMKDMLQSSTIAVSATALHLARQLQSGAGLPLAPPRWYRALSVELLPQRLRDEFQFSFTDRDRQRTTRVLHRLRNIYLHLPTSLRFVGPYNEALARLSDGRPSLAVRLSNRLWIGRPTLLEP